MLIFTPATLMFFVFFRFRHTLLDAIRYADAFRLPSRRHIAAATLRRCLRQFRRHFFAVIDFTLSMPPSLTPLLSPCSLFDTL